MLHRALLNFHRTRPWSRKPNPALFYRGERSANASLTIRFLGTAGFVFEGDGRTIVVDPYVTRPGVAKHLFKLRPNRSLVEELYPRADDVLVGHAHSDHILDAPLICQLRGARFISSKSACIIARAAGVPEEQIRCTQGNEWISAGSGRLKGIPSLHGIAKIGPLKGVPLPGPVADDFVWPARVAKFREGEVLDWHIELAGRSIVHIDSANFKEDQLEGIQADVLCLCAAGWKHRPNYVQWAIEKIKPKYVIPCHWDSFLRPYHSRAKLMPGVDLDGFVSEIKKHGISPVVLPLGGEFGIQ